MYQTQLLLADSGRKGTGISIARDGRVFASVRSKGLVALSPGGGVYPIDVSSLMPDPVAFISAAVAPDGSVVFVSVDGKGIWSAPLEASNKRLSVGQCLVPPEAVSMASHRRLLRMHATGRDRCACCAVHAQHAGVPCADSCAVPVDLQHDHCLCAQTSTSTSGVEIPK